MLTVGSHQFTVNGITHWLDTPPQIINGRTMLPIRQPLEAVEYYIGWNDSTQTVAITPVPPLFIELNGSRVNIGDTLESVHGVLGTPDRIDPSGADYDWHVYNSDYRRFMMVGMKNGFAEAIYTNSRAFETDNAAYGDKRGDISDRQGIRLYFDSNAEDALHAVLVTSSLISSFQGGNDSDFFRTQEMQIFDATNAFRVNHSIHPLRWNEYAAAAARKHSQDMIDRGFFSHSCPDGTRPTDRYRSEGGQGTAGENIARGNWVGINIFNQWVNSYGHRSNMLSSQYRSIGVGVSGIHATQLLINDGTTPLHIPIPFSLNSDVLNSDINISLRSVQNHEKENLINRTRIVPVHHFRPSSVSGGRDADVYTRG